MAVTKVQIREALRSWGLGHIAITPRKAGWTLTGYVSGCDSVYELSRVINCLTVELKVKVTGHSNNHLPLSKLMFRVSDKVSEGAPETTVYGGDELTSTVIAGHTLTTDELNQMYDSWQNIVNSGA